MLNIMLDINDVSNEDLSLFSEYNIIIDDKDFLSNKKINVDILVVDFKPSCLSFIMKMKLIKDINKSIKIIVIIDLLEESLIRLLYDNGIDYILVRPIDYKTLLVIINRISYKFINHNLEFNKHDKIIKILNRLGMPANLKGYQYVKQALLLCLKDNDYYLHTTSKLYPHLAKAFNTKESCIEKAIRNAIELSWCRGDVDEQDKIFGYTIDRNKGRPTNGEFFAQLINYLSLS